MAMYPPTMPVMAISAPPSTGPVMRLACIPTESSAIAFVTPPRPVTSSTMERLDGISNAQPKPLAKTAI